MNTPAEIARKALMLLATRKLAPTPANYQAVYDEVAGTPTAVAFPAQALRAVAGSLPTRTAFQRQQVEAFERAIDDGSWEALQRVLAGYASFDESGGVEAVQPDSGSVAALGVELREQVARVVENGLPALGMDNERFSELGSQVVEQLRDPAVGESRLKSLLTDFAHRLSFVAEDQTEIRAVLLKLLLLMMQSLGEISMDDGWLKRQLDELGTAATPPLSLRRLDELERRLSDVMRRQIDTKEDTLRAQVEMRQMLATFIERLAKMTDSTGTYQDSMERSVRLLEQAKHIGEIAPVLHEVIAATREISAEMKTTRDELESMREKVQVSEAEITRLQEELQNVANQARHDALTGALNRKGLNEAMQRELADVRRKAVPLCVALLDIDNFKRLNDSKGHEAGDSALQHLVNVTRECIRGQDTLARYGGEEFIILMPDTVLEQAVQVMTRLQRILTRRYFMAGNEQLLVTFSAGVAQFEQGESHDSAIKRADQAMYLAKRAGKNRVLMA